MIFNGYTFPSNPRTIKVQSSTNYNVSSVFGENSDVQNISVNPTIVSGEGEFFGEKGEQYCEFLMHMLKTRRAGDLILPREHGMTAYLTDFSYSKNAERNSVSYSFKFVESCTSRLENRDFCCVIAKDGENAFDIANRCNVSVNAIMQKNDFITPFSIKSGDRVVIR